MIDSDVTFRWKGYYPSDLSPGTHKRVWRVCDECGRGCWKRLRFARDRCGTCTARRKAAIISAANIGSLRPKSVETRQKLSVAKIGIPRPVEAIKKMSATKQGIPYDEWEAFAKNQPYCPRFNEICRESNREKYNRECFICGKAESDNSDKTGKLKRLSVHHIDLEKAQGCDGHEWKLIPVCLHCHGRLHKEPWLSRIQYLLVQNERIMKQFEV